MPIYFESQGPPIHGQCGADYRPSENYAIDSGLKPFVVELKFDKKGELIIILRILSINLYIRPLFQLS